MIKTVIRTNNDMVFVFDEHGLQIPEYQGEYKNVNSSIMATSQEETKFIHWFGNSQKPKIATKNNW